MKVIIEKQLEKEEYVEEIPALKNTFDYQLAMLVKQQVRNHKWNQGTRGVEMSWEEAVEEWLDLHYDDFVNSLMPKKKKKALKRFSSTETATITKLFHISL